MAVPTEQTIQFIEQYGILAERDGLSRTAGRMFALMLVEPRPLSFSDLAQRLQVSRGSVSTNTRLLETLGAIERIAKPGDRQDYFQMLPNPWIGLLKRHLESQAKRRRLAQILLDDDHQLTKEQRKRINALIGYSDAAAASAQGLIEQFSS